MHVAEEVGGPNGHHHDQHGAGNIGSLAAAQARAAADQQQKHVDAPTWRTRQSPWDRGNRRRPAPFPAPAPSRSPGPPSCRESQIRAWHGRCAPGCRAAAASQAAPTLDFLPGLRLRFDAPLLHQVEHRGQQAEAQRRVSQQQRNNVRHQPAHPHAFRRETCTAPAQRRNEYQEESGREGQRCRARWRRRATRPERTVPATAKPSSDSISRTPTGIQRCACTSISTDRDEMEEKGQPAQSGRRLLRQRSAVIEHGGEDGDTRRRIKNGRNSEPEEVHLDLTLKGLRAFNCDANHQLDGPEYS